MTYTHATILEAHRRSQIIPIAIAHKVVSDFEYRGYLFKEVSTNFFFRIWSRNDVYSEILLFINFIFTCPLSSVCQMSKNSKNYRKYLTFMRRNH